LHLARYPPVNRGRCRLGLYHETGPNTRILAVWKRPAASRTTLRFKSSVTDGFISSFSYFSIFVDRFVVIHKQYGRRDANRKGACSGHKVRHGVGGGVGDPHPKSSWDGAVMTGHSPNFHQSLWCLGTNDVVAKARIRIRVFLQVQCLRRVRPQKGYFFGVSVRK
jgi:hypothetical protein